MQTAHQTQTAQRATQSTTRSTPSTDSWDPSLPLTSELRQLHDDLVRARVVETLDAGTHTVEQYKAHSRKLTRAAVDAHNAIQHAEAVLFGVHHSYHGRTYRDDVRAAEQGIADAKAAALAAERPARMIQACVRVAREWAATHETR